MGLWNKRNILFVVIICGLVAYPLLFNPSSVSGLGSDDAGPAYMLAHGYHPWVTYLWTPPNSDIEAGLFALQAALGAGKMGYIFGIWHAQARMRKKEESKEV